MTPLCDPSTQIFRAKNKSGFHGWRNTLYNPSIYHPSGCRGGGGGLLLDMFPQFMTKTRKQTTQTFSEFIFFKEHEQLENLPESKFSQSSNLCQTPLGSLCNISDKSKREGMAKKDGCSSSVGHNEGGGHKSVIFWSGGENYFFSPTKTFLCTGTLCSWIFAFGTR